MAFIAVLVTVVSCEKSVTKPGGKPVETTAEIKVLPAAPGEDAPLRPLRHHFSRSRQLPEAHWPECRKVFPDSPDSAGTIPLH